MNDLKLVKYLFAKALLLFGASLCFLAAQRGGAEEAANAVPTFNPTYSFGAVSHGSINMPGNFQDTFDSFDAMAPTNILSSKRQSLTLGAPSINAPLAGFWHFVTLNTPNRLTFMTDNNGVITGIPEASDFEAGSGSLTVDANGNMTGASPDGAFTGTAVFSGQGLVTLSPGDGVPLSFRINSSNDFMFAVEEHESSRGLNLAMRAPSTFANSEVAGTWNVVFLSTPTALQLQYKSGTSQIMDVQPLGEFQIASGTLTFAANGTFTGTVQGPATGTYTYQGSGQVNISVTPQGEATENQTLFINNGKDTMVGLQTGTGGDNFYQMLILTKVATTTTAADLKGHWEIVSFDTPSVLTQQKNVQGLLIGLNGGSSFEAQLQQLNLGNNGFFTAQLDQPASGTATITSPGTISINLTNAAGEVHSLSFNLNAGKNTLTAVVGDDGNEHDGNELLVLAKSPPAASTSFKQDLGLISFPAATGFKMFWPGDTTRTLQSSSDLTNWVDVAGTTSQNITNISTTSVTNQYYRLKETAP